VTILVLVIAAILAGVLAIQRMPRDVFPDLGVTGALRGQPYGGIDPPRWKAFSLTTTSTTFFTSTASSTSNLRASKASG